MSNQLPNAGFLDGATKWTATAGATLAVDEVTVGGPGRAVLTASRNATGTVLEIAPAFADGPLVAAGEAIEVFAGVYATSGDPSVVLQVQATAGGAVSEVAVPRTAFAAGAPTRGRPHRFHRHRARLTSPVAGRARILVRTTLGAGLQSLHLLKPFLEASPGVAEPRWDPGVHANSDLQLPVWPSSLPAFLRDGTALTPTPLRGEFAGDAQVPTTRLLADAPRWRLQGAMDLDPDQVDDLQAFFEGAQEPFWIVRPDTDQLCRAWWLAAGDPTPGAFVNAELRQVDVGLLLEIV